MYYYIEPEVAGGLGDDTIIDASVHPPIVTKLEYQFEGWLGDEVLETFPCFIVTDAVAREITSLELTGFSLDSVKVSKSSSFEEMEFSMLLPSFFWLKVEGEAGISDFGIANDYRLVVSDRAKVALSKYQIQNADFEEYVG
jgi:hypothetical protein